VKNINWAFTPLFYGISLLSVNSTSSWIFGYENPFIDQVKYYQKIKSLEMVLTNETTISVGNNEMELKSLGLFVAKPLSALEKYAVQGASYRFSKYNNHPVFLSWDYAYDGQVCQVLDMGGGRSATLRIFRNNGSYMQQEEMSEPPVPFAEVPFILSPIAPLGCHFWTDKSDNTTLYEELYLRDLTSEFVSKQVEILQFKHSKEVNGIRYYQSSNKLMLGSEKQVITYRIETSSFQQLGGSYLVTAWEKVAGESLQRRYEFDYDFIVAPVSIGAKETFIFPVPSTRSRIISSAGIKGVTKNDCVLLKINQPVVNSEFSVNLENARRIYDEDAHMFVE
jgi:hypothetical protein